jgi:hypothetical protein
MYIFKKFKKLNFLFLTIYVMQHTCKNPHIMKELQWLSWKGNVAKSDHGTETYLDYNSKGSHQKR